MPSFSLSDLRLMYELAEKKGIPLPASVVNTPKVLVLHTDHLIEGDEALKEKKIEAFASKLEKLQENTAVLLKGEDASVEPWLRNSRPGLFYTELPEGLEEVTQAHILGENDPLLKEAQETDNHRWVVLRNTSKEGKENVFSYSPIVEYAQAISSITHEELEDPSNELVGTAFNFFKSISPYQIDRAGFIKLITDPQEALRYPLDPLLRIDLNKAIRFYELISRMAKQSA